MNFGLARKDSDYFPIFLFSSPLEHSISAKEILERECRRTHKGLTLLLNLAHNA